MTDNPLGIDPGVPEHAKIENEAQAINWVEELMQEMMLWREKCNVTVPGNPRATAVAQRRAMWTFLEKQGQVNGALKTLLMCQLITPRVWKEMNQRCINALAPTVVGRA